MRSNFLLLSALLRGHWLVSEDYANMNMPLVHKLLQGTEISENEKIKATLPALMVPGVNLINPEIHSIADAAAGTVAVIPVSGPLMRSGFCAPGMEDIAAWVDQAAANPNITGIIQYQNSGGGTVDYTDVLASKFKAAMAVKPVVTYTDGYMCSAAYWLGSTANHIMVGSLNAVIGSIGTMWELQKSKAEAETLVVRATRSTHKNESVYQARAGETKMLVEEMLDPINENFLATVQENRAGKLDLGKEDVLNGKVYIGKAAIAHGLADSFGTFEDAVKKVLELASAPKIETTSLINSNTNMKKQFLAGWAGMLAIMGLSVPEGQASVEGDLTEEKLAEINAKLEENSSLSAKILELETAAIAAVTEKTKLEADLEAANKKATEAEAKAAAFGAQPGATPTTPAARGNELEGEISNNKTEVDEEAQAYIAFGQEINK
jgi:ClpP class serine protease